MDLKQIEKLMSAMEHSRIKRVVLKREDFEIEIERECDGSAQISQPSYSHPPLYAPHPLPAEAALKGAHGSPVHLPEKEKGNALFVTSPMVGTFYAAPSPDDPSFIKIGDSVSDDTVVCIIEAMKVMNEVKAGVKGTVAEILVKTGEPVEFGTHIFRITPA